MRREVTEREVYEYAVMQVVPRAERGESLNVGVLLHCQARGFLDAGVHLDRARLAALDPGLDLEALEAAVTALRLACAGAGPVAGSSLGQRFRWLTAPRSTLLRTGPAHSGLTPDPQGELDRLVTLLVR